MALQRWLDLSNAIGRLSFCVWLTAKGFDDLRRLFSTGADDPANRDPQASIQPAIDRPRTVLQILILWFLAGSLSALLADRQTGSTVFSGALAMVMAVVLHAALMLYLSPRWR